MPIRTILPRRGTAAAWQSANPILANGEMGYESDTTWTKRGDGVHHWNDLPYGGNPTTWDDVTGKPSLSVKSFGAKGDGRIEGGMSMTAGSAVLTSDYAVFTAVDVGKPIGVSGVGTAGGFLITTITGFANSTHVTLNDAAVVSGSSQTASWGTDDTAAFEAAISAALDTRMALTVPASSGHYVADGLVIPEGASGFYMVGENPASGKFSALRGEHVSTTIAGGGAPVTIRSLPGSTNKLLTVNAGETQLEGLHLTGNIRMNSSPALSIASGNEVRLRRLLISEVAGIGLEVLSAGNVRWESIFVMNCGANDGGYKQSGTAIDSGSAALLSTTNVFKSGDVGSPIAVAGAGTAGGPLITTIAAYTDPKNVTLTDTASTAVSDAAAGWGNSTAPAVSLTVTDEAVASQKYLNTFNLDELNIEYSQGVSLEIGSTDRADGLYPEFLCLTNVHIESPTTYGGGRLNTWPLVKCVNFRSLVFISPFLFGGPGPCISHEKNDTVPVPYLGGLTIIGGTLLGRTAATGMMPPRLVHLVTGDQFAMIGTRVDNCSSAAVLVDSTYGGQAFFRNVLRGAGAAGVVTDSRSSRWADALFGDMQTTGLLGIEMAPVTGYSLSAAHPVQIATADANTGYETVTAGYNGYTNYKHSRGSISSPSATGSGDTIGLTGFSGHTGSAYGTFRGRIAGVATQAWTPSHNGLKLDFYTTPNDSNTARVAATLDQDASLTVVGPVVTAASATGSAGLRLPHGAAPTSPVDGDTWTTTADTFTQINGATYSLVKADASNQVGIGKAPVTGYSIAANAPLQVVGSTGYETVAYGATPANHFKMASGTSGSPAATANDSTLGLLGWGGYSGSAFVTSKASMYAKTTQAWTTSNNGTTLIFRTTPNNSTTPRDVVTLGQDASVTCVGSIIAPAATTSIPSIRLPHGAAPSSPTDGDMWTTSAGGLFVRINGVTKTVTLT